MVKGFFSRRSLNDWDSLCLWKSCLVALCLLSAVSGVEASVESPARSYPLPITELEYVITDWLKASGFVIKRNGLDTGAVELRAVRETRKWKISLTPHSVLATYIQVSYTAEKGQEEQELRRLWAHISYYIGPSHLENSAEPDGRVEDVPIGVLSKIESVVCIRARSKSEDNQFSGFICSPKGLIISTAHGLKGCSDVNVTLHDDRWFKGNVVKTDVHLDLALIRIKARFGTFVHLASARDMIAMGEKLYSIGCPINLNGTVFPGVVNGPQRRADDLIFWQVSMKIHPGSSGSPVFDKMGNLVAVIKGRYRGVDSVGFLIPFDTVRQFLKEAE